MPTPEITLTATLQDLGGADVANASLNVTLCGYGQTLPRVAGTAMIAKAGPVTYKLASGTTAGITLWGNDQIDPAGTYYAIEVIDDKGNIVQSGIYQFNGTQTIDLSSATQLDTPPAGGSGGGGGGGTPGTGSYTQQTVNGNFAVASTGAGIQTFDITLDGNSTLTALSGFARGTLLIFIIRNGVAGISGPFTLAWGAPLQNPPQIVAVAGAVTLWMCVLTSDGSFGSLGPGGEY